MGVKFLTKFVATQCGGLPHQVKLDRLKSLEGGGLVLLVDYWGFVMYHVEKWSHEILSHEACYKGGEYAFYHEKLAQLIDEFTSRNIRLVPDLAASSVLFISFQFFFISFSFHFLFISFFFL